MNIFQAKRNWIFLHSTKFNVHLKAIQVLFSNLTLDFTKFQYSKMLVIIPKIMETMVDMTFSIFIMTSSIVIITSSDSINKKKHLWKVPVKIIIV